jgi:DNA-binding SARP family transcriptional activator
VGILTLLFLQRCFTISEGRGTECGRCRFSDKFRSHASSHAHWASDGERRKEQSMGIRIRLLGDPSILDDDGLNQPIRGYQAWALLARVVLAQAPLDRRSLAAELFPETVDPLGSMRWCLASLRKALNCSNCLVGDPIEANFPAGIEVDVLQLVGGDFDIEQAGRLLSGIDPRCSTEFSTWLLVERERIAGLVGAQIRQETLRAISVEDYDHAIRLAELGVRGDSFNESAHVLLVKSLALAGRHDAALVHVEATERIFLAELGEKPSAALRSAARRTISSPPGGISPEAFVNSLIRPALPRCRRVLPMLALIVCAAPSTTQKG